MNNLTRFYALLSQISTKQLQSWGYINLGIIWTSWSTKRTRENIEARTIKRPLMRLGPSDQRRTRRRQRHSCFRAKNSFSNKQSRKFILCHQFLMAQADVERARWVLHRCNDLVKLIISADGDIVGTFSLV